MNAMVSVIAESSPSDDTPTKTHAITSIICLPNLLPESR